MSNTVILVENISKLYRLGEVGTGTLSHDLNRWWHKVRGKEDPYLKIGQKNDRTRAATKVESGKQNQLPDLSPDYVWALKDINFKVKRGEILGIIGKNGAGKSTLLKILSRVTRPTTGQIKIKGRIASLLEVGTGFNPELTGRDNIYLNGAILGMRKREIDHKFDEIVDFAGVERYIDTPVKRYSSGMYVRLAFAVAAHLEPEILIVDEVLAVGDAEFQKKCLGKMQDVSSREGRTVIFVSHNMLAIRSLCNRALLLRSGEIAADAQTSDVLSVYENQDFTEALYRKWDDSETNEELLNHGMYLKEARVLLEPANNEHTIRVNTPFLLAFCVHTRREALINLSPHCLGTGGEVVFSAPSPERKLTLGDNWFTCKIEGNFLNDGVYTFQLMIVENSAAIQTVNEALIFEVHDVVREGAWYGKWPGVVRPTLEWDFRQPNAESLFAS